MVWVAVLEDEQLIGEECPICAFPLGEVSLIDKERHMNSCLSEQVPFPPFYRSSPPLDLYHT